MIATEQHFEALAEHFERFAAAIRSNVRPDDPELVARMATAPAKAYENAAHWVRLLATSRSPEDLAATLAKSAETADLLLDDAT